MSILVIVSVHERARNNGSKDQPSLSIVGKNFFCVLVLLAAGVADVAAVDSRSYQHGVRFIQDNNDNRWLIWSSSPGNPPEGERKLKLADGSKCSYFTHNIYYSLVDLAKSEVESKLLVGMPEAQEPVDAAVSRNGTVAITYEDGSESEIANCNGVINQRYLSFSEFPQGASKLGTAKINGAHSGHIAAVGNDFVITYAEGWIDGDGAGQSGTANDIYVETISSDGSKRWHKPIAVDKGWPRDWWPLVAGAEKVALLTWQRLVKGKGYAQLMYTLYDPASNKLLRPITLLKENLQYYHFDVQYLPSINRFVVAGNYLGLVETSRGITINTPKLFVLLLDESGKILDRWEKDSDCKLCGNYPGLNLVRESRPAVYSSKRGTHKSATVVYPVKPNAIAVFDISSQAVELQQVSTINHFWFSMGTDGFFIERGQAMFANLTRSGIRVLKIPLK